MFRRRYNDFKHLNLELPPFSSFKVRRSARGIITMLSMTTFVPPIKGNFDQWLLNETPTDLLELLLHTI
jgi:hypothetical protein